MRTIEVMKCAACGEIFKQAHGATDGLATELREGMFVICLHCGTILLCLSPGESRIADSETDAIPEKAFQIACDIVYTVIPPGHPGA